MLISTIENIKPVNMFLGAGISKLAPAYAPLWREMQIGFCEALFVKMKSERWDVSDEDREIEQLRRFNFRPETFWERILDHTTAGFVSHALGILNVGQPNLNHKVIAELCRQGVVNNVVTTNFDEYLDGVLPEGFQRIVDQPRIAPPSSQKLYLKIHGTLSSGSSLQFTLKHTRQLPEWKANLLENCLVKHPLVIAGYSGWDDDVMPFLLKLAPRIPKIIVVRYPGAGLDEPILGLTKFRQAEVVEADFSKETQAWTDLHSKGLGKLVKKFSILSVPKGPDLKEFYRRTVDKLDVPRVPFLTSLLFELAANRELAKKYAWLADDACDDPRYQDQVADDFRRQVRVYLSNIVAAHDSEFSQLLMEQAHEKTPHNSAPVANTMMENIDRVFEYFYSGGLTPEQEREIELYAMGALKMQELGAIGGPGIRFRAGWCMGRLRMRQGNLSESVNFYAQAIQDLPAGLNDVQKCSFFLDCGLSAMRHGVAEQSDEVLRSAVAVLEESERIAVNINDHMTAAKAMMNLSNCYVLCGENDLAIQKVKSAQRLAKLTGDSGLQARAMNLEGQIMGLIAELRKQ